MSETRATAPVFPPGRYGRRRDGRRRSLPLVVAGVLCAALMIALTWSYYLKFGQTDYDPQIIGWSEPTDAEMVIKFSVRIPEDATASCVLRARDYQGYEVGTRTVAIPAPAGGGAITVEESVPTTARGSVGDIMSCRPAA
ncbi:DUF4307 domain-containing protein [Actinoplanes sp. NPDC051851]|uniref:DUF4307 domain-containing protein n=1 Tax=Actinoplanes sp. NPDC051851 TaxID=3154753 RepID=UPI003427AB4F